MYFGATPFSAAAFSDVGFNPNAFVNVLGSRLNVNIGNSERTVMEPMVLGDALKVILEQICDLFTEIKVPTTFGPETPISPTTAVKANNVKNGIERILSIYHKIERN